MKTTILHYFWVIVAVLITAAFVIALALPKSHALYPLDHGCFYSISFGGTIEQRICP